MAAQPGRTVPEVLQDIVGNIQEITRSEFRLAKAELQQEGAKLKSPFTMLVIGGAFAMFGMGFLLWTAALALATVMAMWMATLIVAVVVAIVAVVLLSNATKKLKYVNAPERTIESMKENVQWAKDQIK
jgi:uncharacterized membrane protein YqjE